MRPLCPAGGDIAEPSEGFYVLPNRPAVFPLCHPMDDSLGPIPTPYEGLTVKSAEMFPLLCTRCQRRFTDFRDYVARTTPMFHSSGLMEREDAQGELTVLLLRTCLCGSSVALRCADRRDRTEAGQRRRTRFNTLVALLVESGTDLPAAQEEARRLLNTPTA